MRRKRSPRFIEIAQAAQVSEATVNRVLNERGSVAPATRARVIAAAKQLGVPRTLPDTRHGLTRLDVILAHSATPFFRRLDSALRRSMQMLDRRIVVHRSVVPEDDDAEIVQALLRPRQRRDGLIIAVPDTPRVREALLAVMAQGVPVVTLMSDVGEIPRLHFAGIDNLRAGRTAGHFIGRLARGDGRVLVLSNSLAYRAHVDRTAGCCAVLAERWRGLVCGEVIECFDDADRTYRAVAQALKAPRSAPLVGLYNSGAASAGISAALVAAGRDRDVTWVGHELSDEHCDLIARGTMALAIDQDPDGQVASAMQHLLHTCGYLDQPPPGGLTEFRLFCAENLPSQRYLDELQQGNYCNFADTQH